MNQEITALLKEFERAETVATAAQIAALQQQACVTLPADYIDIMKMFNGGDGEVGENGWLTLFPIEELVEINNDYIAVMEQIPQLFLFGKDAADTGYAFHKVHHTYHAFGLMSDFETDHIDDYGRSFEEFLKTIAG